MIHVLFLLYSDPHVVIFFSKTESAHGILCNVSFVIKESFSNFCPPRYPDQHVYPPHVEDI